MSVVPFEPRPVPEPELTLGQVRLHNGTCNIQIIVHDEDGNAIVLEYLLVTKQPADFDLARLERAWSNWKGVMGRAV